MPVPSEIYEVVSQGMRYWFVFLMAIIVWRSYRWLNRDRRQRKKRLRLLPDAGYVGELVIQKGNEELTPGMVFPVPWEGILGNLRGCDLCVTASGVARKHLWFRYEQDRGLMVKTFGGHRADVDGEDISGRRKQAYMAHGSRLTVGDVVLRLRMFAGFETIAHAQTGAFMADDPGPEPQPDETSSSFAQNLAAMTPEQLAQWQGMQQQMIQQQWQMWMQAQEADGQAEHSGIKEDEENLPGEEEYDDEYEDETEQEDDDDFTPPSEMNGYVVLTDSGVMEAPQAASRRLFNPFAPIAEEPKPPASGYQVDMGSAGVFYPPVTDDGDEEWPYLPYPQSDAVFENQGYTYPEYVEEGEDEDLTDAAAPPKSMYVEPDEAERAKRVVWDKYFGGGRKR